LYLVVANKIKKFKNKKFNKKELDMKKLIIYLSFFCVSLMFTSLYSFAEQKSMDTDAEKKTMSTEIKTFQENLDKGFQEIKQAVTDKRIDDLRQEMNKRIENMQLQLNKCMETIMKESKAHKEKNMAMKTPKKQSLGRWWLRSPLTYDSMPDKILNHFELNISTLRMTGDTTVDKNNIDAMFAIRYKRVTNYLNYSFDKRNTAQADDFDSYIPYTVPDGGPTFLLPIYEEKDTAIRTSEMHEIHNDFRIALYKNLYLAPGFKYFEDDFIQVDRRVTGYMGAGGSLFDNKYISLSLFGAFGYEELEYTDEYHKDMKELQGILNLPDLESQYGKENTDFLKAELSEYEENRIKNSIFYLEWGLNIFPNEMITIKNMVNYIRDVRDPDDYRWDMQFVITYPIAKFVMLTYKYSESFDNSLSPLAGRARNISSRFGVQLSF
ncbi:secreted protein containing DUF481, partial [Candidatus Magnetomorum sp. HK-1]